MKHSLPWESVPPPIYPAQSSLKPRKKWVQVGGWILVVVLLLFGISTRSRNPLLAFVSLAFSVLYLLTLMTKKDAALTSRGLEIFYDMQFTTNYEFFPWEDINAIVCEDRGHAAKAGRFFYLFCPILSLYPDSVLSEYGDNAQQRKLFSAKNY